MSEKKKQLTDNQIHDRLQIAHQLFEDIEGTTKQGETTIKTAAKSLKMLQFALLAAEMEDSGL